MLLTRFGTWKIVFAAKRPIYRRFIITFAVFLLFLGTLYLPKPKWLCCSGSEHDHDRKDINHGRQVDLSFHELSRKLKIMRPTSQSRLAEKRKLLEWQVGVLRMFPIYSDNRAHQTPNTSGIPKRSRAKIKRFTLQNYNFANFNRYWENKVPGSDNSQQIHKQKMGEKDIPKRYDPGTVLDYLEERQTLPECITLRFWRPLQPPTKVCVHSRKEDNVISNQLRDFGHWEPDLIDQMQTFFEHNPSGQLVDLGCNTGVYSLLAARLGRPVLAVDALPANLALLQLAVLTNDRALLSSDTGDDVDDLLESMANTERKSNARKRWKQKTASRERSPVQLALFAELITSLHNAVYNRRVRMYVDITDDPNLGGMEVKELPTSDETKRTAEESHASEQGSDTAGGTPRLNTPQPGDGSHRVFVNAVCLDDLVPYVKQNLSVFLKMDIEGAEAHVLRCADHFFSSLDVRVVQMEILLQRYSGRMGEMTDFFQRHNLWPSEDASGQKMLGSDPPLWPDNMYWIKVR